MKPIDNWLIYTEAHLGDDAREAVFQNIWHLYHRRLLYFIHQYLGEGSEDALQDIMLKVFQNLHRYRPWYAFSTWIYTIARNHCFNLIRRNRVKSIPLGYDRESNTASPETELIGRETEARIDAYLNEQKLTYRQMAYLRFYEAMPLKQIAAVMGIPLGSVKSRLHILKNDLKNMLEKDNEI